MPHPSSAVTFRSARTRSRIAPSISGRLAGSASNPVLVRLSRCLHR
jgi:hypothetical protein